MLRPLILVVSFAASAAALPANVEKDPNAPKPDTYICPNAASAKAVDCFLNAVEHLYTMCRQVKSIEIIEFGYAKSEEGVNGAKSEYCIDKHRLTMTRPYQAALKEATGSKAAVDGLRGLYDTWLKALADLKWIPGETDEQYKARIAKPYAVFQEQASTVRVALDTGGSKTNTAGAAKSEPAKAAKPAAKKPAKSPS